MRLLPVLFLAALLLSPGVVAAGVLDAIAPGTWYQDPNSRVDVVKAPNPDGLAANFRSMMAESGGGFDQMGCLWVHGSGHAEYWGNEFYVKCINPDGTVAPWVRLNTPSSTEGVPPIPDFIQGQTFFPDGRPVGVHSYACQVYMPTIQKWLVGGAYLWYVGGVGVPFLFDPVDQSYTPLSGGPRVMFSCAYDELTGNVYYHDFSAFREWNPTLDTHRQAGDSSETSWQGYAVAQIHPVLRKYVASGSQFGVVTYDLPATPCPPTGCTFISTRTPVPTTGASEFATARGAGFRYHPPSGKLVAYDGGPDFGLLDLDTKVWTRVAPAAGNAVIPPPVPRYPTPGYVQGLFGRLGYIEALDLFVVVITTDTDVYYYRPSWSPVASLPPATKLTFAERCASPGVVRCLALDTPEEIARYAVGSYRDPTVIPVHDPTVGPEGKGSARFTIPSLAWPNTSGTISFNFTPGSLNFSKTDPYPVQFGEGEEFYLQWRQRFTPEHLAAKEGERWKQIIIGEGDRPREKVFSCTQLELVATNNLNKGFPILYHSCGLKDRMYEGIGGTRVDPVTGRVVYLYQNALTNCEYHNDLGCWRYKANQWITFQIHVKIGTTWYKNDKVYHRDSRVRMWAAYEGEPSVLLYDRADYDLANTVPPSTLGTDGKPVARYGKAWLLPYNTGRDPLVPGVATSVWYAEVIVSREPIPDPE